jgi:pyridinium-3,5-bisthiocarboxylic acid mononucleotide nickel chelatase
VIGWIDGSGGASGDMLLGALVDVGVPIEILQASIDSLDLGIALSCTSVTRAGLGATKVHVDVPETTTNRHLADIVELLAAVSEPTRSRAGAVFERLAVAEAAVHRMSIDEVHFHEVGALDSIADVVGVCAGFAYLELVDLQCSTLSLGNGQVRGAHGPIPVPVPAVLAVLEGVVPVTAGLAPFEATTPTGAALLAEWVTVWGSMPSITVVSSGSGAGANDSDAVANICRLVIGDPVPEQSGQSRPDSQLDPTIPNGIAVQIDANVDDLDPRVWPTAIAAALDGGAFDAWVTPIVMKKGRPAHTFSVLCGPDRVVAMRRLIFTHTSTIGMREHGVTRHMLDRRTASVDVGGQTIRVKLALLDGAIVNRSVEWDDVVGAAVQLGRSTNDVLAAATAAALEI